MVFVSGHAAKFFIIAIGTRSCSGQSEARLAVLAMLAMLADSPPKPSIFDLRRGMYTMASLIYHHVP
jgi:hypothetical protein